MSIPVLTELCLQFYYGEDGIDISKAGFLNTKQYPFLLENTADEQHGKALSKKVSKRKKEVSLLIVVMEWDYTLLVYFEQVFVSFLFTSCKGEI